MQLGYELPGNGFEHSTLVQQVKNLQRESDGAKTSWHRYCDAMGGAVRDPKRHSLGFLQSFFEAYRCGVIPEPPAALHELPLPSDLDSGDPRDVRGMLVARVKHGQRTSQGFKESWWSFCDIHHGGVRDPGRHETAALRRFLEDVAPRVVPDEGSAASRENYSERDRTPPPGLPPGAEVSALADRVKQMQRRDNNYKQQWAWYCDNFGGGVRDPARHPPQFLQQYIHMVEGGAQGHFGKAGCQFPTANYHYGPYDQSYMQGAMGTSMAAAWGGYPGYMGMPGGYMAASGMPAYGMLGSGYPAMVYPGYGYPAAPGQTAQSAAPRRARSRSRAASKSDQRSDSSSSSRSRKH